MEYKKWNQPNLISTLQTDEKKVGPNPGLQMECWCGDSWKQAGDKTEGTNPYLLLHSEFTSKSTWKPSVSSLLAHFIFHRSPPFPGLPTLNFLTKFHTDLVVSWLFVWGTLPAGLICLLLQKTNLSSISHVLLA